MSPCQLAAVAGSLFVVACGLLAYVIHRRPSPPPPPRTMPRDEIEHRVMQIRRELGKRARSRR